MPVRQALAVTVCAAVVAGCSSGGSGGPGGSPFAVGPTPTGSPGSGAVASLGGGVAGDLRVTEADYVRAPGGVSCLMVIANSGSTPDRLVAAESNLGGAATITPRPMPVPGHASVAVDGKARSVILPVTGTFDPGSTVAMTLTFAHAGPMRLYLSPKS